MNKNLKLVINNTHKDNLDQKYFFEKDLNSKDKHEGKYKNYDVKGLVEMIHKKYFEKWITHSPSQWLWVHKRWKL